jgi:hypothetical protein
MIPTHCYGVEEAIVLLAELLHLVPRLEWIDIMYAANPRNTFTRMSVKR